jgi:hypothetical protein
MGATCARVDVQNQLTVQKSVAERSCRILVVWEVEAIELAECVMAVNLKAEHSEEWSFVRLSNGAGNECKGVGQQVGCE